MWIGLILQRCHVLGIQIRQRKGHTTGPASSRQVSRPNRGGTSAAPSVCGQCRYVASKDCCPLVTDKLCMQCTMHRALINNNNNNKASPGLFEISCMHSTVPGIPADPRVQNCTSSVRTTTLLLLTVNLVLTGTDSRAVSVHVQHCM